MATSDVKDEFLRLNGYLFDVCEEYVSKKPFCKFVESVHVISKSKLRINDEFGDVFVLEVLCNYEAGDFEKEAVVVYILEVDVLTAGIYSGSIKYYFLGMRDYSGEDKNGK